MQRRDTSLPKGVYWMGGKIHDPQGLLTEAPELPDIVTFDIADGSFSFYTKEQFEHYINELRNELVDEGHIESDEGLDFDDVLDMVHGDEFFWEWLPKEVK
jgi:hypothetical protein